MVLNGNWVYAAFGVALALVFGWSMGWLGLEIVGAFLPILGFTGFNGLLAFINERGWYQYVNTGVAIVGGLLFWFGVLTPEGLAAFSAAWASLLGSAATWLKVKYQRAMQAKVSSLQAENATLRSGK